MSSIESFDGLCGIICMYSTFDQQVRCKYEFGHTGDHSWVKKLSTGPVKGFFIHETTINKRQVY